LREKPARVEQQVTARARGLLYTCAVQSLPHESPPSDDAAEALADFARGRSLAVLTGAGCSTESGIPDYRGPGTLARAKNPIELREFLRSAEARACYWARSSVGWRRVAGARPNAAHHALARLERAGVVRGVITQNVDRLHHVAGSRRVIELHGALADVRCLGCGALEPRARFQERLLALNPGFEARAAEFRPDGDAELLPSNVRVAREDSCKAVDRRAKRATGAEGRASAASERRAKRVSEANAGAGGTEAPPTPERVDGPEGRRAGRGRSTRCGEGRTMLALDRIAGFRVAECARCGGVMKPNVVFFGESVPRPVVDQAYAWVEEAGGLLVVGTSLTVFSGFRFVKRAAERGRPIAIVNLGATRGDALAELCIDAPAGRVVEALARALA
jgi:NAD-dependent SIR2 family protein deacetylase